MHEAIESDEGLATVLSFFASHPNAAEPWAHRVRELAAEFVEWFIALRMGHVLGLSAPSPEAIDRAVDEARGQGLRGFALYLSPRPGAVHSSLLRLARQGRFSLPLTLPVESGSPRDMSVPAGTSLTVLCYSDHKIVSRHVLPGKITDTHLSAVLADMKRLAE